MEIKGESKKVAGFLFSVIFNEKEDGCSDNGKVNVKLFKRETVIYPLENVLVEGSEGDDCPGQGFPGRLPIPSFAVFLQTLS